MPINFLSLNEKCYIKELPDDILLKILKQDLDITDLKAVREISRKGCELASDGKI